MTKLVLFDMDGTLSDDRQRQHFYQAQDWDSYFSYDAQMADPVYEQGRALYDELLFLGWDIGYLTARLERNRPATVDWLTKHEFKNPETAILRPEGESIMRPPRFKANTVRELIDRGDYEEVVLVDNDPLVIERITEELGAQYCFFADWDKNPDTASLSIIVQ